MKARTRHSILSKTIMLCAIPILSFGCVSLTQDSGVPNTWRSTDLVYELGTTTQSEVMTALGPPSQVIDLEQGPVLYYMKRQVKANSIYYVVYNIKNLKTSYDRAVFFFDTDGVLLSHAISVEKLPTGDE